MHAQAKNAANSADKNVKNVVGGLSDLPELPNPFKGSGDVENVAKDAKNKVRLLTGVPACLRNLQQLHLQCSGGVMRGAPLAERS